MEEYSSLDSPLYITSLAVKKPSGAKILGLGIVSDYLAVASVGTTTTTLLYIFRVNIIFNTGLQNCKNFRTSGIIQLKML